MKRFLAFFLSLFMVFSSSLVQADTPAPIETIPFAELPPVLDGQYHYLLLCVDQWNGKPGNLGNTDGMVLVTLDTRAHRIMLTSCIRDAIIKKPAVPGENDHYGRINYIAKNYSPETLCQVMSEHLGVRIEKYVLFDFQQIANIVDYLGGVDIDVTEAEASYLRKYPLSPTQTSPRMGDAGTYKFTGRAAVIYMRIRKAGGGGDFMRTQRARTVLSTLADQCRNITYDQAKALVDSVMENTTLTNMTLEDMLQAMDQAYGLRNCTIEELRIPIDGASHPINFANMAVQEIDWNACRQAMDDYLQNSWLVLDE